jgi:nucleoid DNA-binding protein
MKFTVSQCVKELLYEHECVILPNFGGIITSYKGAEIDHISFSLTPPTKSISYNSYLKKDDGLLTNAFATLNKLSYSEASLEVKKWIEDLVNNLYSKCSFSLEGIGLFSLDKEENKISFNPIDAENFLMESYGMPVISANPILRSKSFEKKETQTVTPITDFSITSVSKKRKNTGIYNSLIYTCIALILTSTLLSIFNVEINKLSLNQASVFQILNKSFNFNNTTSFLPTSNVDIVKTYPIETHEELKIIAPKISIVNPESKLKEEQLKPIDAIAPYRVVAGVFKEDKNASRMYAKLKQLPLSSNLSIEKNNKLSYIFFSTYSAEEAKLIQSNLAAHNFESWIKKL